MTSGSMTRSMISRLGCNMKAGRMIATQNRIRSIPILQKAAIPNLAIANLNLNRQLHSSTQRFGSGSTDSTLSSLLSKELSYEKESIASAGGAAAAAEPQEPDFLKEFKQAGIWKIHDSKGSDEVKLKRQFGNEDIRILFSISDVDSDNPTAGLQDEEMEEAGQADAEAEGIDNHEGDPDFNFRCAITISKPTGGALTIDAQVEEGSFVIENMSYYKDAKLADDLSAEADWARRGMYIGPQFETLDGEVQQQFTEYLEERGIDTDLACFIPSYAEWKEQREYVSWLEQVKDFIDA